MDGVMSLRAGLNPARAEETWGGRATQRHYNPDKPKTPSTFLGRDAELTSRMGRMDEAERAQVAELLDLKSRSQA